MAESPGLPIARIEVRLEVGKDRMAGSDDPLYLGLRGPQGREFRLLLAHGPSLRRGAQDHFVLGAAGDSATNVAEAEFNDPTSPQIDAAGVSGTYLRKGFEPIPNVRAFGEMDDRLEIVEVEVEIHTADRPKPVRYMRTGPIWLGLVCGLHFEVPRVEDAE